jgi:UDP-glucuronate decarboxylase
LSNPYFELIRHDVTVPILLELDQIYNLACPASPVHYQQDPVKTIRTNIQGAINMLDLALNTGARILQASTSEVYGDPEIHPQTENYWGHVNPIGPRSCYDEGKRCAETLFFDYFRQYGVDIKVVRIFNTYGPRMDVQDGRVISNFIGQALNNSSITLYGDGMQTRSFCYVSDLIEALVLMMDSATGFTGPINLGNPQEVTIRDIATKIIQITDSKSEMVFCPLPTDDPRQRRPDISLAQTVLGWKPTIGLDEGLRRSVQWFCTGSA